MEITPGFASVAENNDIVLTCKAQGKPAPALSWYYETDTVNALMNSSDYEILTWDTPTTGNETIVYSSLNITMAGDHDVGKYYCGAKNKLVDERIWRRVDVLCEL